MKLLQKKKKKQTSQHPQQPSGHPNNLKKTNHVIRFNIFADVILTYKMKNSFYQGTDEENYPKADDFQFTFNKHHYSLMGRISYKELASVFFDIALPNDILELKISPISFFTIKVGKIFVPFGESNIHHIYGGKVD